MSGWLVPLKHAAFAVTLAAGVAAGGWTQSAQATPALGGSTLTSVATATYVPNGYTQTETVSSNSMSIIVMSVEALTLTQSQSVTRPPSASIALSHLLTNIGNTPSSYTLALTNNGTGCDADTFDLSSLQVVRDNNNNGVVDPADPVLTLATPGVLTLKPGEIASLLVVGNTPNVASGTACLALEVTTVLQALSAVNNDTVILGNNAVLNLTKSASYSGLVLPGVSDINFTINGTSIGAQDVQPTAQAGTSASAITVNGTPITVVLIRDAIPVGSIYNANSLQTSVVGALKLYRTFDDAPFAYRQGDGGADAIELAIGIPAAVARNSALSLSFSVRVRALYTGNIVNNAQAFFADGVNSVQTLSNTVVIASTPATIGLAKSAGTTRANVDSTGQADGTANVTFSLRVKNYGSLPLYGVQIADVMEGASATQFGTYTAQAVPGVNQYTVVAGSLAIVNLSSSVAGTLAQVNPAFTGQAVAASLLATGAVLPAGAEFTVTFITRINTTSSAATLLNTATASAALAADSAASVFDVSTNGTNPDPDGYGNPGSSSVPTPVSTLSARLSMTQISSLPRRISSGVYELDYTFKVTNSGTLTAPNVRVIDNFNCTFDMDLPTGKIANWQLIGLPVVQNGVFVPTANFSGTASCDRTAAGLVATPLSINLSLVDGSRGLLPGQSETLKVTLRITQKPEYVGKRTIFTNKAWVASLEANAINQSPAMIVGVSDSSAQSLLIDPVGTVYNALTRAPIAGAVVTFARNSCSASAATPIIPAEIQGANIPGLYTFNADGSMSMTTGANGAYEFFFISPPVNDVCTYSLSVAPPAGSGYKAPSLLIPAQTSTFGSCGLVAPNVSSPTGSDPTTFYTSVKAGLFPGTSNFCEVLNNHFPLDPGNVNGLVLKKEGSKTQAEFGDFMDYALTVSNKTGFPVTGVSFTDVLPPGLAYVAGSARLNGQPTLEPVGGPGPRLQLDYPSLAIPLNGSAVLRYRVRIGVGAPTNGDVINRAWANSGVMQSNPASFKTHISGGVFSDEAFAFGKVYLDCKRTDGPASASSQSDEMGIPGVRLYLENGTHVITDAQGKWSLYGLKPITHVLRLDQTTLPRGAILGVLDNRNSGAPESRFVDLKKGEFHKADFIVTNCDDTAMRADVAARRAGLATRADTETEALVRMRLDPERKPLIVGDTRALPASNLALAGGPGAMSMAVTQGVAPLIELPAGVAGMGGAAPMGNAGQASGIFPPLLSPVQSVVTPASALVPAVPANPMRAPESSSVAPDTSLTPVSGESSSAVGLKELMPKLDNQWAFIDLADGGTVPSQVINVRLKGQIEHALRLTVNGEIIEERRVGMKAVLESKKLTAWEYIGIALKAGVNTLQLDAIDSFGNIRATQKIQITAPDKLALIQIDLPAAARADLRTPIQIKVRLTDASGVPVTARTQLTLEADRGRWLDTDLNPLEPGTQVFMEGGSAQFNLLPPGEPGDARVRVSSGSLFKEVRLALLPEIRPMIGVGIVEGVLDFTKRGALTLGAMPAGAAFETELSSLHTDSANNTRASARSAFFFKGTVKGDYLLTAALDTDKTKTDRLFRDIRPDEFYPVYGDASVKGFDAQSSQKLYVRIDKNRSYLLYGDFTTASSAEVRQLSQSNRTLTGIKNVYETSTVRATSYAAQTAQTQQVEEFASVGTSGPYFLNAGNGDIVLNSEVVTVVVRDRTQPGIVLRSTPAARFVDYTLEPFTRRLLFTHAISSVDSNLNPQSIRVSYEVANGSGQFLVAGTDIQLKITDYLQLGVVSSIDNNPDNKRKLGAVTALARLSANTTLTSEVVQTETDLKGSGYAARAEMRQQTEQLTAALLASKTSDGFDNPGAATGAGRTDASARAEYKLNATTTLRGEAVYGKTLTTAEQTSVSASVLKKISDTATGEVGLRHGPAIGASSGFNYAQTSTPNGLTSSNMGNLGNSIGSLSGAPAAVGSTSVTTVRARLASQVPGLPKAQVFVEGEQALQQSELRTVAVGTSYAITDKTRAYGRYELVSPRDTTSALTTPQSRNTGIFGIESNYMEGGRVYNEYRLAEAGDAHSLLAAMGVRNAIKVNDQVRVTAGLEQTKSIGSTTTGNTGTGLVAGTGAGNSTAVISGAEYMTERTKASGIAEFRRGSDAQTYLVSAGFGYKIDADWSLLARSIVTDSQGQGANVGNDRRLMRHQFGLALRPAGQDVWNALARYEHKLEHVGAASSAVASTTALGGSNVPGNYSTDIISAHVNVNPERGNYITARYAGKVSRADDGLLASSYWAHLVQARYTRDIAPDWDVGVQAGMLMGKGGALQKTLGLEGGYQVSRNMWASVGYNVVGLTDRDLAGADYTSKGIYVRLRFKFDENTLGLGSAISPVSAVTPVIPTRPDQAQVPLATPAVVRTADTPPWQPGAVFPTRLVLSEAQLFVTDQTSLSASGTALLSQLGAELAAQGIGAIDVIAGDPVPGNAASNLLWLGRAAAVRNALRPYGPRVITISVNSQALLSQPQAASVQPGSVANAVPKSGLSLQIALKGV